MRSLSVTLVLIVCLLPYPDRDKAMPPMITSAATRKINLPIVLIVSIIYKAKVEKNPVEIQMTSWKSTYPFRIP